MSASPTAAEIAAVVRIPATTIDEAAHLIEAYAKAYAGGEVIKALEEANLRTMAILEAPLTRARTDA